MDIERGTYDEQSVLLWNGPAGRAWVEAQELIDEVFKPLENMLAEVVGAESVRCVLDVGCGTGSTTFAAAHALGNKGCCVGLDISVPMITAARARAERENALRRL